MAKPKIFVSYSHKEAAWAKEFAQALSQRGLRVWIDQLAVKPGESIREAVEKGFRESDVFVALIDPSALSSPSLFFELGAAIGMDKRVVAIVPANFDLSQFPLTLRARRFLVKRTPEVTASELLGTEQGIGLEA
jgi:nucleoside 2-deoxyribosyltransferase